MGKEIRLIALSCRHCGKTISKNVRNGQTIAVCRNCRAVYEINRYDCKLHIKTLFYDFESVS